MQLFTVRLLVLAFLGLGVVLTPARAESIGFSYSWTVLPSPVFTGTNPDSGNGLSTGSIVVAVVPSGTATAELNALMPAFIPAATLSTSSSATGTPDSFSTPFQVQLQLTDEASGQMSTMNFAGTLAGELTATSSTLISTFSTPHSQGATLGGYLYTVMIDPVLASLPVPGSQTPALLNARVMVTSLGDTDPETESPIHETPEPGTLLLGAAAVGGLMLRRALRRRG